MVGLGVGTKKIVIFHIFLIRRVSRWTVSGPNEIINFSHFTNLKLTWLDLRG